MLVDEVVRGFVASASECPGLDCLLERLADAVMELRVAASVLGYSGERLVREFLEHPDVMRVLARLSDSINVVREMIRGDERFEVLRPYASMIAYVIARASDVYEDEERVEEAEAGLGRAYPEIEARSDYGEAGLGRRRGGLGAVLKAFLAGLGLSMLVAGLVVFYFSPPDGHPAGPQAPTGAQASQPGARQAASSSEAEDAAASTGSRAGLGDVEVYANGTHLIVEERWNGEPRYPYLVIEGEGYKLHLTPYLILGSEAPHVTASYVFVNSTYARAVFPLGDILEALRATGSSDFEISLYDANKVCSLHVDWEEGSVRVGECRVVYFITLSTGDTFYDVIFESFNESTLAYLRGLLYGGLAPGSVAEAAWRALEWVDENVEYDYSKTLTAAIFYDIADPVSFARSGRGICSDYAVFLAAALLSAGVEPVYILTFNTTWGGHAVAAVEVDGSLFVLDQHLPVMEWSDYLEYAVNVTSPVYAYRVTYDPEGGPTVEFYRLIRSYGDSYPLDRPSQQLARDVCEELALLLGASCEPACTGGWWLRWSWEALKYYSPLFHDQWVDYVAGELAGYIDGRPACIQVKAVDETTIIVYYR